MSQTFILIVLYWSIQKMEMPCGGVLTETSGEITSPDFDGDGEYDHLMLCTWQIIAPENKRVEVLMETLRIDVYNDCGQDNLKIWDGNFFIGVFCGTSPFRVNLTSQTRIVTLKFKSNNFYAETGFTATYNMSTDLTCGYTAGYKAGLVGTNDIFEYGFYQVVDCFWSVGSDKSNSTVGLWIFSIDIRPHDNCSVNHVQVYDSHSLDMTYCGNTPPSIVYSTSPDLYIHLESTNGFEDAHFMARYLIKDEYCGGFITDFPGDLSTPAENPDGLPFTPVDCVWFLVAPEGYLITAEVISFRLEKGIPYCLYDTLEFYEESLRIDHRISQHCTTAPSAPIRSNSNNLIVRYVSEHYSFYGVYQNGFAARYAAVKADAMDETDTASSKPDQVSKITESMTATAKAETDVTTTLETLHASTATMDKTDTTENSDTASVVTAPVVKANGTTPVITPTETAPVVVSSVSRNSKVKSTPTRPPDPIVTFHTTIDSTILTETTERSDSENIRFSSLLFFAKICSLIFV